MDVKIKFTVAMNVELSKPKVFCVKSRVGQTGILPAARSSGFCQAGSFYFIFPGPLACAAWEICDLDS